MELNPEAESLINSYVNIAISQKDWDLVEKRIEHLLLNDSKLPMDIMIKLSMLHQMKGDVRRAEEVFQQVLAVHIQEITRDKKGYRKITLFDNGESRIEFYKSLKKVKQVVITFDSLYMDWDEPSFGFHFILRQDVDLIAVRKRKKGESQQHLTQEEFVETVGSLINGYEKIKLHTDIV